MITPQQEQQIQAQLRGSGLAPAANTASWYQQLKASNPSVDQQNSPSTPSYETDLADQLQGGGDTMVNSVTTAANRVAADNQQPATLGNEFAKAGHLVEGGLGAAAGAAQTLFSPLSALFQKAADTTGIHPFDAVMATPEGQAFAAWAQKHPEAATNLQDALTVASSEGGAEGAGAATSAAKDALAQAPSKISELLGTSDAALPDAVQASKATGGPLDALRTHIAKDNVDPRLAATAERADFTTTDGTPETAADRYSRYFAQSQKAVNDVKEDPAIAAVGENIGKAYDNVIGQRRAIGQTMGDELKQIQDHPADITPAFYSLEGKLKDEANMTYDAQSGKLQPIGKQSSMTADDQAMVQKYIGDLNELGAHPTVGDIDAFLKRVPADLDMAKAAKNITKVTNGERIIKSSLNDLRNTLDPEKTGDTALQPYSTARKAYADLSGFLDEGSTHLGAKLKTDGEYSRDTSVAKSAAESIVGGGKKSWLMKLEGLTKYPALDDTVLAIQAMKDAGDTRGLSLFKALADGGGVPTPHGIVAKMLDFGAKTGSRLIAGKPNEQTLQFLRYIENRSPSASPSLTAQPITETGQ